MLCVGTLAYGWPGVTGWDSDEQYAQAVSGHLTDWHPPIMAWLWSVLRLAADGPGPMFALQVSIYWFALGCIGLTLCRLGRPLAGGAVLAVGVAPPFIALSVHIVKDVGLAASCLASFAICFWHRAQNRRMGLVPLAGAGALLFYGSLVRANGVFAAAPLLIYLAYPCLCARPGRFIAACVVFVVLAIPAGSVFNHGILRAGKDYPLRSLQIFDVTGIAYFARDMSVFWPGPFTSGLVADCYTPVLWDTLGSLGANQECRVFWNSPSPQQGRTWAVAILRHPFAYAQHRLAHFNSELQLAVPRHIGDPRVTAWVAHGTRIETGPRTLADAISDGLGLDALLAPAFALLLGAIVLASVLQRPVAPQDESNPCRAAVFCLVTSGLAYMSGYLFIGVASDFRYFLWPMMAIYISAIMHLSVMKPRGIRPISRRAGIGCLLLAGAVAIHVAQTRQGDALLMADGADPAVAGAFAQRMGAPAARRQARP